MVSGKKLPYLLEKVIIQVILRDHIEHIRSPVWNIRIGGNYPDSPDAKKRNWKSNVYVKLYRRDKALNVCVLGRNGTEILQNYWLPSLEWVRFPISNDYHIYNHSSHEINSTDSILNIITHDFDNEEIGEASGFDPVIAVCDRIE